MVCYDKNVFYYGRAESLPVKHQLKAGLLQVVYENGCLRYISSNGRELIRNIYSAVRDQNWGTIMPVITAENIQQNENEFQIQYTARYTNEEIDFVANYIITGTQNNTITFEMKGKALRTFRKNRIGICVLHPLNGVKGQNCKIIHPDNTFTLSMFPVKISGVSPVSNITAMEWKNVETLCFLEFEGDIWEMEDHRNWTDSSYKTYCTPLAIPFPAQINERTEVNQKVTLKAYVEKANVMINSDDVLIFDDKRYALPEIGTSIGNRIFRQSETDILKEAGLKFLRHDLKFKDRDWAVELNTSIENAATLSLSLELVLHFSPKAKNDVELLLLFLSQKFVPVKKIWIVNDNSRITNNGLISDVVDTLREVFPNIPIGGGTDAYFAELNRNLFDATRLDFISFAVCPQVHAFDNDSLTENIAAQADTVESAQFLYPGKKIQVSPVTLKQRFNVVATGEELPVPYDKLPAQVDERQMSLFASGWMLGSIASLTKSGTDAITYFEATGWKGIIQGEEENARPALFAGNKGDIYPVYHLLRFIHKLQPSYIKIGESSNPLKFIGIMLKRDSASILILANYTSDELTIKLPQFSLYSFFELSADNMVNALKDKFFFDNIFRKRIEANKVKLEPYSLSFVEFSSK